MYDRQKTELSGIESLPLYNAKDLTKGGTLATISLHDQIYVLRITRAGKLLLTK